MKAPPALMLKWKAYITKLMNVDILHKTSVLAEATMFVEAKGHDKIHQLVYLHFTNNKTQAHHTRIQEQNTEQNTVARELFGSKLDLTNAYF